VVGGELQVLLVLLGAIVAAREREDHGIVALQCTEPTLDVLMVGEFVVVERAAGTDVGAHTAKSFQSDDCVTSDPPPDRRRRATFTGDERRSLEIEDCVDDVVDFADPPERVKGLQLRVRSVTRSVPLSSARLLGTTIAAPAPWIARAAISVPTDVAAASDATSPTIGEMLVDPVAEQAYEKVLDDLEIDRVLDLTDELEERERAVIRSHYGLGQEPRTLSEIGAGLGLTAERARQIEAGALTKLRQALAQPAPIGGTAT
jgi:RNA polymerase sigma factor (sigma-70 family)